MEWVTNTPAPSKMRGWVTGYLVHEVFMTLHSHSSVFSPLTWLNSINDFFFHGKTSHPLCDAVGKCDSSVCGINETRKL